MLPKVAVICAIETEFAPFLAEISAPRVSEKAMLRFYEGSIEGVPVVALFCGVGRVNAAVATQILIDRFGVNAVINGGTAGAVAVNLGIFDTVIATESLYHDMEPSILTDYHPGLPSAVFPSDEDLLARCREALPHVNTGHNIVFGRIVTGEAFIEDDRREDIIARFNPLAVDMETAGIAHVCYVNRVPFVAIRAITDTADHSGANQFAQNCVRAARISKDVVAAMLRQMRGRTDEDA